MKHVLSHVVGRAEKETVFRGHRFGNALRVHAIARSHQFLGACHVDRERRIEPAGKATCVANPRVVATRQNGDARACRRCAFEHDVRERSTRVGRNHDVGGFECHLLHGSLHDLDASR